MSLPVDTDNLNMLKDLIGDDLKEILHAYLDSAPDLLMKISHALSASDTELLRLHAHSLKGSSANIGAHDLSEYSARLEKMAKDGNLTSQANELFTSINSENQRVEQFLKDYINQM